MDPFATQWAGLVVNVQLVGRHAPAATLIGDGTTDASAAIVPSAPTASIMNVAITHDPGATPPDLAALAERYRAAGVAKWGLWTDARNAAAGAAAGEQGMVLDSTPAAMVANLDELPYDAAEPRRTTDLATVGRVNDRAYGMAEPKLEPVVGGLPASVLTYASPRHESVALAYDNGPDTLVWFVATLPEAQRRGLAGALLKRLLLDARERGQATASLQASAAGRPLYARLGFTQVGELHFYEERLR
jgi:GNAT superfamily N-acetyltransferase